MKAIIDTSSLRALARYYLPFDKNGKLISVITELFQSSELLVLDIVTREGRFQAKGLIYNSFSFLYKKNSLVIDTTAVLPSQKIFSRLENDFCDQQVLASKGLDSAEFEGEKNRFLSQADAKIILYAMKIKSESPLVVSEETVNQNDNKLFKKIPALCGLINTGCCTLPAYLQEHCKVDLGRLFS